MRRSMAVPALIALFLACAVLLNVYASRSEKPYSSYSTLEDGAAAAYLMLEELGFRVERKTTADWDGEGVVIALGTQYLPASANALVFEEDWRYTNDYIRYNAVELVELLWPYRDAPVYFEEYGRSFNPVRDGDGEVTLLSIMPLWLKISLFSVLLGAFFLMFFCNQRIGRPRPPKGFEGRPPLEGVQAVAGAWQSGGVYRDCAAYYYNYRARHGDQWDRGRALAAQLAGLNSEHHALWLMGEMDKMIKEYRNER